ncbi:hypothetical protein HanPSC8_Chr01g0019191 [Helianthus annuus]|nr:hypothetical protein HanPSC8_Chr01g0019191 [Helianthus annuus]
MKSRVQKVSGMPNYLETIHLKMILHKCQGETDVWLDKNNDSLQLWVVVDLTMRFVDVFLDSHGWCSSRIGNF